jgi:cell division septation protein DedD
LTEENYTADDSYDEINSFENNDVADYNSIDDSESEAVDPEPMPVEDETISAPEQTSPLASQQAGFYIIAGAFRDKENADKLINQLRSKGYEAVYAGQTNTGLWRIAFEAHQQRSAAIRRLAVIQNEENPGAWIFSF